MKKRIRRSLFALAFFILGILLMVNIHEIGHTVFARLLGDPDATYLLYGSMPGGGACFGCNFYDPTKLTPFGNLVVSLGGVFFTQGTALTILWRSRKKTLQTDVRRAVNMLFYIALFDLPFQVLQGLPATAALKGLTWVDMRDFFTLASSLTGLNLLLLKILLVVLVVLWVTGAIRLYHTRPVPPPQPIIQFQTPPPPDAGGSAQP